MALSFAPKKQTKDYGRVEDGSYVARIVQIIDMGMQEETDYKTGEVKVYEDTGAPVIRPKVWINFELPTETINIDGVDKPRWYGREFTISSHEKAVLALLLKAADPKGTHTNKGTNVRGLLGLPVMVNIGSTASGKAKVTSVSAVPKGLAVDPLSNPETFFDLDEKDVETFGTLPVWMQDKIKNGVNFEKTPFASVLEKSKASMEDY